MQLQFLFSLMLGVIVSAQTTSLTDALGSQNSSLSSLNSLLQQNPQLLSSLDSLQSVTILAPNNDAINAISNSSAENSSMLNDTSYLQSLLSYHILNGTYYSQNFSNMSTFIPTMLTDQSYTNVTGGQRVEARAYDNNVTFLSALKQNASVVTSVSMFLIHHNIALANILPNVNFTGGTIHIVNNTLTIPMNATDTLTNANLTAAAGALMRANLTQPLADMHDVTIFAPNNDAFNAIGSIVGNLTSDQLSRIVGYHIVNGSVDYLTAATPNSTLASADGGNISITSLNGTVFANSARVTIPNLLCENGVIHVVDAVLNPNSTSGGANATASTGSPAYTNASSATSGVPFTSGVATPTTTYPAATSAGGFGTSSSTAGGAALPVKTGAVGAAALFGGAAIVVNF